MQIVRRPLAPGETNHELLWLSVSSGGLALAATWLGAGARFAVISFASIYALATIALFLQALAGQPFLPY